MASSPSFFLWYLFYFHIAKSPFFQGFFNVFNPVSPKAKDFYLTRNIPGLRVISNCFYSDIEFNGQLFDSVILLFYFIVHNHTAKKFLNDGWGITSPFLFSGILI